MHETFRARLGVIVLASGNPGASLRDAYLATGTGCTYRTNSAPAILLNQQTLLKLPVRTGQQTEQLFPFAAHQQELFCKPRRAHITRVFTQIRVSPVIRIRSFFLSALLCVLSVSALACALWTFDC